LSRNIGKNTTEGGAWTSGKHLLITGASSGIGREIALRSIGTAGRLTLIARNSDKLHSLMNELTQLRALRREQEGWVETEARCYSLDVRDTEGAAGLIDAIYDGAVAQVDAFINCAGGSHIYGPLETLTIRDIEEIMDVNGKAPIFWLRYLLARMKHNQMERAGLKRAHVMMLSSRSGERALPNLAVYAAAKGAVEKLVEAVRTEYAYYRIAFTLVNPGSIGTAFTALWPPYLQAAHNAESMTVEEAVEPIMQALNSHFGLNKLSYESLEQWRSEPGVLAVTEDA
jgi:short-subunit dehydrogenase